jgi:hypothetical protein
MLVLAAALVPHPPLLVPALAAGAAPSVAPLLEACEAVLAGLLARSPSTVVLVGSGVRTARRGEWDVGILAGFGTGSAAGARPGAAQLPLSLTIGCWLLERAQWSGDIVLQEVAADTPSGGCEEIGRTLAAESSTESVWLALGDGSIRRGQRSPGHDDPRAAGFDTEVARAFGTADLPALLGVDVELAAQLGAVGRPVWQVLAGAVRADPGWATIEATVHYDDAPFGVEYLVADWRPVLSSALPEGNENQ